MTNETTPLAEFLTVDELATLLRVSRWTAYRALEAGHVAGAKKIGSTWRICRSVLVESFRAQSRVGTSRRRTG